MTLKKVVIGEFELKKLGQLATLFEYFYEKTISYTTILVIIGE